MGGRCGIYIQLFEYYIDAYTHTYAIIQIIIIIFSITYRIMITYGKYI